MLTVEKITTKDKEKYINERNEREIKQIKETESRIDQDKLEIKGILDFINNDSLSRSHNSVNISFSQMLAYVDKIRKPIQDADIKFLLQTYREMAERFYTQFEFSLLKEIKKQHDVRVASDLIRGQINIGMLNPDLYQSDDKNAVEDTKTRLIGQLNTAIDLLTEDSRAAADEFDKLTKDFPTLMQKALDQLKREWQRLNTLAVASMRLAKDKNLIRAMKIVVESARISIDIGAGRIAIVPGDDFSVQFYSYLRNFAVLTIPIYSVQAPWEWSIFWHELAGEKVRQLEKNTASEINTINTKLEFFHNKFRLMTKTNKNELLNFITRNNRYPKPVFPNKDQKKILGDVQRKLTQKHKLNRSEEELRNTDKYFQKQKEKLNKAKEKFEQNGKLTSNEVKLITEDILSKRKNTFSRDYLGKLFSKEQLTLVDLGGFEHQFERMLENLPQKDKFQMYAKYKKIGWSVEWFKELFEDAWSVLAIRESFVDYFQDVLSRHVATDGRHPPEQVRLDVANEILRLLNLRGKKVKPPVSVEESAAQQILKFISLLIVSNYNFDTDSSDYSPEGFLNSYKKELQPTLPDIVGNDIGYFINQWSKHLSGPAQAAKISARDLFIAFSENQLQDFTDFLSLPYDQVETSYEEFLAGKDYKRLLDLSFYDVDFGYPVGLTATFKVGTQSYRVSAMNVVNNSGVFTTLTNTPKTPLPDRTFSLTDLSHHTTWFSVSERQQNDHSTFFTKVP